MRRETLTMEPIKPIGQKIIDHPQLAEWTEKGQASQECDGLWLHYAVVCTLLKEAQKAVHAQTAASEMLEALDHVLEYFSKMANGTIAPSLIRQIEVAIQKARGAQ